MTDLMIFRGHKHCIILQCVPEIPLLLRTAPNMSLTITLFLFQTSSQENNSLQENTKIFHQHASYHETVGKGPLGFHDNSSCPPTPYHSKDTGDQPGHIRL